MFTNQDILTLAKAGFNAQQIAALNSIGQQMQQPQVQPQVQQQVQPQVQQVQQVQPQVQQVQPQMQPQVPQVQPQVQQQAQGQNATIDDVLNSLNGLTQTFQNGFLLNSQQPKPATAEDILAEIINPPTNINEGGKS